MQQERQTVLGFFLYCPSPKQEYSPSWFSLPASQKKVKILKSSGTLSFPELSVCVRITQKPKRDPFDNIFSKHQGMGRGLLVFFLSKLHFSGFLKTQNFTRKKPVLELSGEKKKPILLRTKLFRVWPKVCLFRHPLSQHLKASNLSCSLKKKKKEQ